MIIGEAAGIAASMAIAAEAAVQDIDIKSLQDKLHAHGGILRREDAKPPYFDVRDLPGIVLDEDAAETQGEWGTSRGVPPYVGYEYLHEKVANTPDSRVRYTPELPKDGRYEVRMSYTAERFRAQQVRVVIQTAEGQEIQFVNQQKEQGPLSPFISLGTFAFKKGKQGYVEIQGGVDAGGFIVADAVQWLPKE